MIQKSYGGRFEIRYILDHSIRFMFLRLALTYVLGVHDLLILMTSIFPNWDSGSDDKEATSSIFRGYFLIFLVPLVEYAVLRDAPRGLFSRHPQLTTFISLQQHLFF